jgi:hypothetical protein
MAVKKKAEGGWGKEITCIRKIKTFLTVSKLIYIF